MSTNGQPEVQCYDCAGEGYQHWEDQNSQQYTIPCLTCNRTGVVSPEQYANWVESGSQGTAWEDCGGCNGTGYEGTPGEVCAQCNGLGGHYKD